MSSLFHSIDDYIQPWLAKFPAPETDTFANTTFALCAILPASYLCLKRKVEALSKQSNNPEIRKKRSLLHEKFQESKVPSDLDYIIIGSGMGGLSCAAILARLGRKVVVLEQHHDVVGGGTHMFDLKGFPFDSGLHYTVPWSVPLLALTCLKKPKDCTPFDLMTESDGTIDRLFILDKDQSVESPSFLNPLRMRYGEGHFQEIYQEFPHEKQGIDAFITLSNRAMEFVKYFFLGRLFPKWIQRIYWSLMPSSLMEVASQTAQQLLPKYIKDHRLISLFSSMWIDTGCRPDQASFALTASVFRGISLEGGCYPRGGSTELAKELVTTIESNGGKVFIRADVEQVLFSESLQRVHGVQLNGGKQLFCKHGVISSTGYHHTMNNLVSAELTKRYDVPRALSVKQSAGFVMANIGINAAPEVIQATKANTWYLPVTKEGDIFLPMKEYFHNPLQTAANIPAFITFPSVKDTAYQEENKTSCQILLMAEFDWFKDFLPTEAKERLDGDHPYDTYTGTARQPKLYEERKKVWEQRILELFYRFFPKAREHLAFIDISTPLSIQYYLRATHGAAVGIDCTPERFCDPYVREQLDPISKIPGLALTGQDTAICGVTLCQLAGVITALRLEGFWAAMKILFQSILLGNQ